MKLRHKASETLPITNKSKVQSNLHRNRFIRATAEEEGLNQISLPEWKQVKDLHKNRPQQANFMEADLYNFRDCRATIWSAQQPPGKHPG